MSLSSLDPATIAMLKRASDNGLNQISYNALVEAAEISKFFAGQLNAAAYSGFELVVGTPGQGTSFNGAAIVIDEDMIPKDTRLAYRNRFITLVAHELGHATLFGGFGNQSVNSFSNPLNPEQAAINGGLNESIAFIAEYVVASQIGTGMQSGIDIQNKLQNAFNDLGVDVSNMNFSVSVH